MVIGNVRLNKRKHEGKKQSENEGVQECTLTLIMLAINHRVLGRSVTFYYIWKMSWYG